MTADYFRVGTHLSSMELLRLSSYEFVYRQGDLSVTRMGLSLAVDVCQPVKIPT